MFFLVAMHFEQATNHRKFPAIMWLVFCGFRSYHVSNSSTVAVITNCPMWWMWVWPGRCEKYQRDHRFEFSRLCKWNSTSFLNIYFYVHIDLCGPSGYLASHLCLFSPSFSAQCFLRITMWYIDIQDTCSVTPIRWVVYIGSAHIDLIYPVHFNLLLKPTWVFF